MPDPNSDLRIIAEQENLLRFPKFTADTAWDLGKRLRSAALEAVQIASAQSASDAPAVGCSMQISMGEQLLFACATEGAAPTQANWIRRKRNTVLHFGQSSYRVGRELAAQDTYLQSRDGLALEDYAAHGGGFPIFVGDALAGTVVFSGLPQRDDHAIVVRCLAAQLGLNVPSLP